MKRLRQYIRKIIQEATIEDVLPKDHHQQMVKISKKYPGQATSQRYHPEQKDKNAFIRNLKSTWNKHADHSFFQDPNQLTVIHMLDLYSYRNLRGYFSDLGDIHLKAAIENGIIEEDDSVDFFRDTDFYDEVVAQLPRGSVKIPGVHIPNKNELSCYGYIKYKKQLDPNVYVDDEYSFFTFKKYRVTFASNDDVQTERLRYAGLKDKERHKSSGLPKRPFIGTDIEEVPLDEKSANLRMEEVIIDNWVIDTYYGPESDRKFAEYVGINFIAR